MAKITIAQGEAKTLPFRVKSRITGQWLNLTGATFLLWVKRSLEDTDPVFTKVDDDFNKAGVETGYVSLFLSGYDTWQEPWCYTAEIRVVKAGSPAPIAKLRFDLEIEKAITPTDFEIMPLGITSLEAIGSPII
jgi:hypothetical protein